MTGSGVTRLAADKQRASGPGIGRNVALADVRFDAAVSKPEKLDASICFPLFTQQRTSPRYFGMSVLCQFAIGKLNVAASADHAMSHRPL